MQSQVHLLQLDPQLLQLGLQHRLLSNKVCLAAAQGSSDFVGLAQCTRLQAGGKRQGWGRASWKRLSLLLLDTFLHGAN